MDKPITLKAGQISALAHRLKEGVLLHRLSVSGPLTRELAADLACQDLAFLDNGAPKQGLHQVRCRCGVRCLPRFLRSGSGLEATIRVDWGQLRQLRRETNRNGFFQLSWRMNYHGDPHPALAYLEVVGGADSALRIVPLEQQALFAQTQPAALEIEVVQ